ncbi:MAG: hypothetical protein LDL38_12565 [Flavobacterium piscis]|nr:hypothetical protein [Flavobacterium piscis]
MLVSELIEKLQKYPQDLEVRVMNVAIEDDESCPTFEVKSISSAKENDEDLEEPRDMDFVFIEMLDNSYIMPEFDITKE